MKLYYVKELVKMSPPLDGNFKTGLSENSESETISAIDIGLRTTNSFERILSYFPEQRWIAHGTVMKSRLLLFNIDILVQRKNYTKRI